MKNDIRKATLKVAGKGVAGTGSFTLPFTTPGDIPKAKYIATDFPEGAAPEVEIGGLYEMYDGRRCLQMKVVSRDERSIVFEEV